MSNWHKVEGTKKAVLWQGIVEDTKAYVVSIGNGIKPPPEHEVFRRDKNGMLIVKGSYWRYLVRSGANPEEVKKAALSLYEKHC